MSADSSQAFSGTVVTSRPRVPLEDPLNFFGAAVAKLHTSWLKATYPFASFGRGVRIHPSAIVSRSIAPGIKLGDFVIIRNHAWINTFDLAGAGDVKIIIDDHTVINAQSVVSAKNRIHIEDHVMVSACSLIMDHNHAYEDVTRPIQQQGPTPGGTIRIEQGCWIGHGAAIVCNQGELVLGRNCGVAANALVTRSFPAYSVIVGNPARIAKQFDPGRNTWVGAGVRISDS
jgi:acetyltransferase-like isoleucine patch superfamily enzyme